MNLTTEQRSRARGVLVGTACGDALGAPLEFGPVIPYPTPIAMIGGGAFGWQPGEWTDDTSMTIIIAKAAAAHRGLTADAAMNDIAAGFHDWAATAKDVGSQTRHVLGAARFHGRDARSLTSAARDYTEQHPTAAGNGSLMRTAALALAHLDDAQALADAAANVSALTHANQDAIDACILWTSAIRTAVLDGELDGLADGLKFISADRRDLWAQRIAEATSAEPWDFPKNGWVVHAFQAAWSAIACTKQHDGAPTDNHFTRTIDHSVRCGGDTDTVAAIAGGLVGALHGITATPQHWFDALNGWPGMDAVDLVELTDLITDKENA